MHGRSFDQWYGNWASVITYLILFGAFVLGFARSRRRREWQGLGIYQGFLVALFTEMFGAPLTIYYARAPRPANAGNFRKEPET